MTITYLIHVDEEDEATRKRQLLGALTRSWTNPETVSDFEYLVTIEAEMKDQFEEWADANLDSFKQVEGKQ
jgi:hypothetical protein